MLATCGILGVIEFCDDHDGGRSGVVRRRGRERKVTLNQHQALSRLNRHFIYMVLAILMGLDLVFSFKECGFN
jgi:uncharacterized membrane protein